ncbi:MAG: hypothetical protein ABIQ18_08065 [Umezawaea sp.]
MHTSLNSSLQQKQRARLADAAVTGRGSNYTTSAPPHSGQSSVGSSAPYRWLDLSGLPEAQVGRGRTAGDQALARRGEDTRFPVLLANVAECSVS